MRAFGILLRWKESAMATAKKSAGKKAAKKVASKRAAGGKSVSLTKEGKDPKGGLTAAGRQSAAGSEGCGGHAGEEAAEGIVFDAALYDASRAGGEGWQADAAGAAGGGLGRASAEDRGG